MSKKRIISKEVLEQLYITERLTLKEVAARLHASVHTVYRNMEDCRIPTRTNSEVHTHHGMSATRPYHIWQAMKTRCTNEGQPNYRNYGGRGISYPPEWETFEGFWRDMAERYADDKTLDRIDNSKGYSKENCRWTTCKRNSRNKRDNVLLTYQGKTQCIAAWAEEVDIPQTTLYNRKYRGWSDEEILTTPVQTRYNPY